MALANYTDQQLLALLAQDSEAAFALLYERSRTLVKQFALRIAKSNEAAEEIVQNVLLKLWIQRATATEIQNFQGWLHRVTTNEAMNTYDSRLKIGVSPESRDFSGVAKYLVEKGLTRVTLMTNNPLKKAALINAGIELSAVPLTVDNYNQNVRDLYRTKRDFFNHDISPDL